MNISSITSAALQAAQNLPTSFEAGNLQKSGIPLTSFSNTLASHINEQAQVALHPNSSTAISPSHEKGLVMQMIENNEKMQSEAGHAVQGMLKGEANSSLHKAMIAMEEASVSFQMLVEMRNKIVESLQELMRMQI